MELTPKKLNNFMMLKLPSAWFCGVRVERITGEVCITKVRYRWINQNPFNSLYFAVQAMAAELSTGALVMQHIRNSGKSLSMLVLQNNSRFFKKAKGRILFRCEEGNILSEGIAQAIRTGEGKTFWLCAKGYNEQGEEVSRFEFQWSIRLRTIK